MIQGIMAIAVATIFIMSGLNFNLVTALTAETGNIPGSEITSTDGSTSAPYSPEQSGSVPAGESNSTITSESSSPPTNGEGQINSPANSLTQTDGAASETESNSKISAPVNAETEDGSDPADEDTALTFKAQRPSGAWEKAMFRKIIRNNWFVFPVDGKRVFSNDFGTPREGYLHQGIDVLAKGGVPVVAVEEGVAAFKQGKRAGNYAVLRTKTKMVYKYMHLSKFAKGGKVRAGDVIGYVGNTGNAMGGPPHLHFEMWYGGLLLNPYFILKTFVNRKLKAEPAVVKLQETVGQTNAAPVLTVATGNREDEGQASDKTGHSKILRKVLIRRCLFCTDHSASSNLIARNHCE